MTVDIYPFAKKILFKLDPETAHRLSERLLSSFHFMSGLYSKNYNHKVCFHNLCLRSPFGIAAGFDKNAHFINFFKNIPSVSHIEIGTVTKRPQEGNSKPRIWRYKEEESLRNAMGFPNDGSCRIKKRLMQLKKGDLQIGVNVGKQKNSSPEESLVEYKEIIEKFKDAADYFTINLSSPNTPGLKSLQNKKTIGLIDSSLAQINFSQNVFIKLSPDLTPEQTKSIVESIVDSKSLTGVISTNTLPLPQRGKGGFSGKVIREKSKNSREKIGEILRGLKPKKFIFVGAGGISTYEDLTRHWRNYGDFVQIYTAFIYQGPKLFLDLAESLERDLKQKKIHSISELIEFYRVSK